MRLRLRLWVNVLWCLLCTLCVDVCTCRCVGAQAMELAQEESEESKGLDSLVMMPPSITRKTAFLVLTIYECVYRKEGACVFVVFTFSCMCMAMCCRRVAHTLFPTPVTPSVTPPSTPLPLLRAEGLPALDANGTDAFVEVNFAGNKPLATKYKAIKGTKDLACEWKEELWLPVLLPTMTSKIEVRTLLCRGGGAGEEVHDA